jgi:hypothetical protein
MEKQSMTVPLFNTAHTSGHPPSVVYLRRGWKREREILD